MRHILYLEETAKARWAWPGGGVRCADRGGRAQAGAVWVQQGEPRRSRRLPLPH